MDKANFGKIIINLFLAVLLMKTAVDEKSGSIRFKFNKSITGEPVGN